MRRRLLIIIALLVIVLTIFIVSGCGSLSKAKSDTDEKFKKMSSQLTSRYEKLNDAIELAVSIGGERDVTNDGLKYYKQYSESIKNKDTKKQLEAASELENIIGRLRANSVSSIKLSGSQELKDAIMAIDDSTIAKDVRDDYKNAAKSYEEKRTSWRNLLSATVCGYSPIKTLEFSEAP
jgi:hypothetical protein